VKPTTTTSSTTSTTDPTTTTTECVDATPVQAAAVDGAVPAPAEPAEAVAATPRFTG
jgi:hypothetical protein